jgi:hypothetical protein
MPLQSYRENQHLCGFRQLFDSGRSTNSLAAQYPKNSLNSLSSRLFELSSSYIADFVGHNIPQTTAFHGVDYARITHRLRVL